MEKTSLSKMEVPRSSVCPVCGRELPAEVSPSRCPHCLLRQGLADNPRAAGGETVVLGEGNSSRALPLPGETFGHYRIGRLLGQGGMGAVFEAEDLDSGRRVALKVLGHRMDSPEARSRFFREGRLAASVNHPNSVYVYGTEEIAGIPVIAMELVAGGTLQDRVTREGPLPVADVVESILQVIAGLEAAQRVGVLHRDVKPSNCFVEVDGCVKVGDFGLSVSTLVRTEPALTSAGVFLGTPAFASPEQLRGDELTVRADIYSVGVTLYYLLSGHHPFAAPNLVRLLATVLERPAASPAAWRPDLPRGLCRVVLRCLEKDPERRFRNYEELRNALLPFAPAAPKPATLALRGAAYVLDGLTLLLPGYLLNALVQLRLPGATDPAAYYLTTSQVLAMNLSSLALGFIYFGLLEGLWGTSAGKALCGLRVIRTGHRVPGVPRALLRVFILSGVPNLVWLLGHGFGQLWTTDLGFAHWMAAFSLLTLSLRALLFVTARRQNGFAGLHDLASGTRVVVKTAHQARSGLPLASEPVPTVEATPLVGPYHVLNPLGSEPGADWLLGFDARLLRRVWIRKLPPGTAPIPAPLRQVSRPGRLRWLGAQRTATEAWDAYEALSGQPLVTLIAQPQPWSSVRYWLLDLAEELRAATHDGSLPATLTMGQVWITADGRAKLLDSPAPGTAALPEAAPAPSVPAFLQEVGCAALEGRPGRSRGPAAMLVRVPLARHAERFLETLVAGASLEALVAELRSLLSLPARISSARRAVLLAAALVVPVLAAIVGSKTQVASRAFLKSSPEVAVLRECLARHHELMEQSQRGQSHSTAEVQALETYIAGRFAPLITNTPRWHSTSMRLALTDPFHADAESILSRTPMPSPPQFTEAVATVDRYWGKTPDAAAREAMGRAAAPVMGLWIGYANAVLFVIVPCLVGSLLFRGGALVKLLGIVFVDPTGALASRWRVTGRNLLAWSPFLLLPFGLKALAPAFGVTGALLCSGTVTVGLAVMSVLLPERGLADRLAGTWPVPR
jgi:eukaryotic-like serine/threonine-protein kinase